MSSLLFNTVRFMLMIALCLLLPFPYGIIVLGIFASYEYSIFKLESQAWDDMRFTLKASEVSKKRIQTLEAALFRKRNAIRKMSNAIDRRNALLPQGWRDGKTTNDIEPTRRRVGSRGRSLVAVGHEQDGSNS